ncbi:MAG: hypothetical protein J6R46_00510 [Clostridia bacterium]|nr:hypothetical protein [Clostridia bacterium]
MTMSKVFEQAIKAHVKERDDLLNIKGVRVLKTKFVETIHCSGGEVLTKFEVVTAVKAKGLQDNRVKWQVNVYDDPEGRQTDPVSVYYDGRYYEA